MSSGSKCIRLLVLAAALAVAAFFPTPTSAQSGIDEQLAANAAGPGQDEQLTGDEGTTVQVIDHYDELFTRGKDIARQTRLVSMSLASLLLALGVIISLGSSAASPGPNPARLIAAGLVGAIGIAAVPEIMDRTSTITLAVSRYIDTIDPSTDIKSATVRVFDDMANAISTAFEKGDWWTLITSPITQFLMYIAWFLAILFYAIYRFVWQVGWIALEIVGPFAMAAACTGTSAGFRIAKGWFMSMLNLACWPIAMSILFSLINLGIHDYAQDPSSIGFKQALVAFIVAFSIPMALVMTKTFLSGGGLDTNLAGLASQMTGMAVLTSLGAVGSAISQVPIVGGLGQVIANSSGDVVRGATGAKGGGRQSSGASTSTGEDTPASARQVAPMPGATSGSGASGAAGGPAGLAAAGASEYGRQIGEKVGQLKDLAMLPVSMVTSAAKAGAAGIGNMAMAAMDNGAREAGHIRTIPFRTNQSQHGRGSDRPKQGKAPKDRTEGGGGSGPENQGGPGGGSTPPSAPGDQGDEPQFTGADGGSAPPTSRASAPAARQPGSSSVGAASSNLTGGPRPPTLDDLGLGRAFGASRPAPQQATQSAGGAAGSEHPSRHSTARDVTVDVDQNPSSSPNAAAQGTTTNTSTTTFGAGSSEVSLSRGAAQTSQPGLGGQSGGHSTSSGEVAHRTGGTRGSEPQTGQGGHVRIAASSVPPVGADPVHLSADHHEHVISESGSDTETIVDEIAGTVERAVSRGSDSVGPPARPSADSQRVNTITQLISNAARADRSEIKRVSRPGAPRSIYTDKPPGSAYD